MREWLERLRTALDSLSTRERILVALVGVLVLVSIALLAVVQVLDAMERSRVEVTTAEQELEVARQLHAELGEVQARLSAVERRIREGAKGNIFTTLESLARQSAIKVDSMEPQTGQSGDRFRETKVEVTLKGVTLAQLTNYLHRIETAAQLLSIKSLRLRTRADKPDLLDVNFTVSSFEAV